MRERVTVIEVFSITCAPCEEKLRGLRLREKELTKRGASVFYVVELADGESVKDVRTALHAWKLDDLPFVIDDSRRLTTELDLSTIPEVYVLDTRARLRWVGGANANALQVIEVVTAL